MEPALKIIKIFPKTFTTDGIFIEHLLMPNIFYFTHIQKKMKGDYYYPHFNDISTLP